MIKQARAIARKELSTYFGSPMALIFLGTFLVVTLFAFFWVETFFARNIADVRPLFRWMPILTIFLVAALTMRQWSEEQRSGTLEVLLTLPVQRIALVLGKFIAVMAVIVLALALTLFLPITVSLLGRLDWGPVAGGYLAAVLMSAAYAAIGLCISSRTDNPIVSLILTVVVGGAFYLVGSSSISGLGGNALSEVLRAIGTGSRFESIERGVIDLRDLIYYLSLTAVFLVLNVVSLSAKTWSRTPHTMARRRQTFISVALIIANLVALNTWLFPVSGLRADLTAGREYSLSSATRDLIGSLQEPLLIRAYISAKTHPLLAPLAPNVRDMLREYQIASNGKIKAEVVDPRDNEELEAEANQTYGIQPTPFRLSGRYESSVINSYFDILIRYGDQNVTLGFGELIEVESQASGQVDVRLRNLEYDLTRSIKKVVYGFQSIDAIFASMTDPVKLTAFITPQTLPASLQAVQQNVTKVAQAIQQESGGKFTFEVIDPDASGARIGREELFNTYGLRPIATSFFSPDSYYLHLLLQIGDESQLLYPQGEMTEADIRSEIEAALKRAAPGFLKTVGVWVPNLQPMQDMYGQTVEPLSSWNLLGNQLQQSYTLTGVDLSSGRVPGNVDVLLIIAPQGMSDMDRFAIDQFLMRGGAVVVAAGNYALSQQQYSGSLSMEALQDNLKEMLAFYGVEVRDAMVMDPQNEPFPVQVQRQSGGYQVIEVQQVSYPYFVDVRTAGMAKDSVIVSSLPAVTLQWCSPLEVDADKNANRQVTVLLQSTAQSWLRTSLDVQPNTQLYPKLGFPVEGEVGSRPLAVTVRGSFESFFKDKEPPVPAGQTEEGASQPALGTITTSPESSRLVVVGSNEFVDDVVLNISARMSADRYLNNLQFVQNAIDWCVEDEDLLTIRSRGTYAHMLKSMDEGQQRVWEIANYAVALLALIAVGWIWNVRQKGERPMLLIESEAEGKK